ncbi:hypothetical protein FDECE_11083 [Fusarium decemcellulare]|nr:hypothetical protein FDECE_11083 [Fusarium decemcellulare]
MTYSESGHEYDQDLMSSQPSISSSLGLLTYRHHQTSTQPSTTHELKFKLALHYEPNDVEDAPFHHHMGEPFPQFTKPEIDPQPLHDTVDAWIKPDPTVEDEHVLGMVALSHGPICTLAYQDMSDTDSYYGTAVDEAPSLTTSPGSVEVSSPLNQHCHRPPNGLFLEGTNDPKQMPFQRREVARDDDERPDRQHEPILSYAPERQSMESKPTSVDVVRRAMCKCDYPGCHKAFRRNEHLKRHKQTFHGEGPNRFSCEFCGKDQFNRQDNLNNHRKLHARPNSRNRGVEFIPAAVPVIEQEERSRKRRASSKAKVAEHRLEVFASQHNEDLKL